MTDKWTGWQAIIQRNDTGTYGIEWRDAPAMEARGGYSGPFDTEDAARQCALDWAAAWGMDPNDDLSIIVAVPAVE